MRWVILTDDHPPLDGGVAAWTRAVTRGLRSAGHEVAVFARERPGLPEDVVGVSGPSFGRWGGVWMAAAAWRAVARADRVLATTWPVATGFAGRMSAPLQVAYHGSDLTRPPRDPEAFRRVALAADRRWVMSGFLAGLLEERGFEAHRLPVPVDPDPRIARRPAEPRRWVFVGRATPLKGGDRFVRLVEAAGAAGTVIGDGPSLQPWRELASMLRADVTFTGRLPHAEVRRRLRDFDLACLLPRPDIDGTGAEGLGLSLVEAAAAGVAPVGCRTGGVPDAVGPGLVLEDPDDIEDSLAVLRSWWTPARGGAARWWVGRRHGVARAVAALCA